MEVARSRTPRAGPTLGSTRLYAWWGNNVPQQDLARLAKKKKTFRGQPRATGWAQPCFVALCMYQVDLGIYLLGTGSAIDSYYFYNLLFELKGKKVRS